jgi:hypothetical protein
VIHNDYDFLTYQADYLQYIDAMVSAINNKKSAENALTAATNNNSSAHTLYTDTRKITSSHVPDTINSRVSSLQVLEDKAEGYHDTNNNTADEALNKAITNAGNADSIPHPSTAEYACDSHNEDLQNNKTAAQVAKNQATENKDKAAIVRNAINVSTLSSLAEEYKLQDDIEGGQLSGPISRIKMEPHIYSPYCFFNSIYTTEPDDNWFGITAIGLQFYKVTEIMYGGVVSSVDPTNKSIAKKKFLAMLKISILLFILSHLASNISSVVNTVIGGATVGSVGGLNYSRSNFSNMATKYSKQARSVGKGIARKAGGRVLKKMEGIRKKNE